MAETFLEVFERAHRSAVASFNAGDWDAAFASFSPDIVWEVIVGAPESALRGRDGETLHGREQAIRYFEGLTEGMEWNVEPQEFLELGESRFLVHQHGVATAKFTGIVTEIDIFQIWELTADGQVARIREFASRDDALAAAP